MPAEARLARRGGEPCAVPFRGPTGGLRTARPALRAPRLPRTARGVRAHGRNCRRVAARASPPAIAPNATQRFRQVFRSAAIDPAPAASVPTGVPGSPNPVMIFMLRRFWRKRSSEGQPVLHLNDISPTDKPQRPDSGVIDHNAFGSRGFEAIKQHLTRKGVPFRVNEVPNSTRRQIFVTDPNNVLIELNFDVAKEMPSR